ncbi:MFS transporter [Alteraurantiacibacter aquimixticola]|uniref:MFS transporter n=1 Tax=Alteraurantiacibacter aquimixticola TaxID=2489173 RepID=A0A4T3F000_9SPHN|nr:MFS transporter [Alteraurantiacibacter aquimixticola]TIX50371.1 MFS transporter [Alteraurantiacibacter aquimixticola]
MLNTATFSPLRHRAFAVLVTGSLLANLGNTIQSVGASWHLTEMGQPADVVALVQTAFNLPIMLLALPAGAWSDMVDKRKLLLISLFAMLAISVLLALLVQADAAGPAVTIVLTALLACGVACIIPAVASAVNFSVPRGQLAAAVALNILGFNVARSFGPALGGAITSVGGASAAFIANAAAYLLVIALLWRWRMPEGQQAPKRKIGPVMMEGLRYAFASQPIRTIMLRAITFTTTGAAAWAVMPLFASEVLGKGSFVYGLLLAALGAGAVIGAASATWFRSRFSAEAIVRGAGVLYGSGCILVALQPSLPVILGLLVLAGAGWVQALSGFAVAGQMWSPQVVVGRIAAMISSVTFGGIAIGSWLWGHFADAQGITTAFMASGAAMIALPLLGLVFPLPSHVDAQPSDEELEGRAA